MSPIDRQADAGNEAGPIPKPPANPSLTPVHGLGQPHGPGVVIASNSEAPRDDQKDDESIVARKDIAISVMQASYDQPSTRARIRRYLRGFLGR